MANKLFDVETGLKIGDSYWFSGNGNIIAAGTIVAGNIQVTGATAVTNIQFENTQYQYATNLSSPNVFITGGSLGVGTDGTVSEMANLYAQLGRFGSLSIANALITGASATTLVATNFSSGNIYQSAAGTLVATNFSSGNIYQSAADTFVATNFSSGNIYQSAADTFVATNFSAGNIYQIGTNQSIQTANAQIGSDWGDTSRANLVVGNIRVLNATTGNVRTLVATNFSSGNVTITGTTTTIGIAAGGTASPIANIYTSGVGNFGSVTTANVLMTGDITQSATGTFSYDARTLVPKQYTDVMSVVFGS